VNELVNTTFSPKPSFCRLSFLLIGCVILSACHAFAAIPGKVVAWGNNDHLQLNVPPGLNDAIAISAGQYHNLALRANGTVVAWGENGDGQASVPAGLSNVVAISAGYMHNLALKKDGSVVAWGNNWFGQGVAPADLTNITAISAGYLHNIVLRSNGVAVAWGYDGGGNGQTTVPNNSNIVGVAAGGVLTMILKNNGTTVGFGTLAFGSVSSAQQVAPGYEHNMALGNNGIVTAWGNATWLQTSVPGNLNGVAFVTGTHYHCLALRTNGVVVGWGRNDQNQAHSPNWLTNALAVSTGELHSLAIIPNPPPPTLTIVRSAPNVIVSWSVPEDAYALESATNLLGPFDIESPILSTNQQTVSATVPTANARKFFRLRKL
jgi:alpha-tubulin suppressor-like RCC1 family protein